MNADHQVVYSDIEGVRGWVVPRIRAELYDHTGEEGNMMFPVATAYLEDHRDFPWSDLGVMLAFIFVPDQCRRKGYAKALILAINERFPDMLLTDAISPEGEALTASLEATPGFFHEPTRD